MRRRVPAPPYLLLALATLFWSGNFVLGRAVSGRIPPAARTTRHRESPR